MLSYKLFGAGMSTLMVEAMKDSAAGLTATGTTQGTAYEVTTAKAGFTTVASGAGAILDSDAAAGDSQMIYNGGANALLVYPPSGSAINNLAANSAALIPPATSCEFFCLSTTLWTGILSN